MRGADWKGRSKGRIECKHVTRCYQLFIIFFSFLFRLPSAWFLWTAQHEKMAKSIPSSCLVTILRTNTVMHTEQARKTNLCQLVDRPTSKPRYHPHFSQASAFHKRILVSSQGISSFFLLQTSPRTLLDRHG